MKKIINQIKPLITKYTDPPTNMFLTLPKITIIGQNHIYIENHVELVTFRDTELKLKLHKGFVQINGKSFVLKTMLQHEILLEGFIDDVKFIT